MNYKLLLWIILGVGILVGVRCMTHIDNKHKHENVLCDLPEEYPTISKDSTKPTEMIAYYRDKKLIFGFKH